VAALPKGSSSSLVNGLLAFWALEEATNTARLDCSGNGYSLIPSNTPVKATGIIGSCDEFSQSGSKYLQGNTVPNFVVTNGFSVVGWMKITANWDYDALCSKNDSGGIQNGWFVTFYNYNYIYFQIYQSASRYSYQISSSIVKSNWNHIACTYSGTGGTNGMTIYVNGSPSLSSYAQVGAAVTDVSPSTPFGIGVRMLPLTGLSWVMVGLIDEVGLWTRAITSGEVSSLYNSGAGKYFNCQ